MRKFTASLVFLALALTAFGAPSAASLTESNLNVKGQQVFSAANTTDAADATSGWASIANGDVFFGPGAVNDTIFVFGINRLTAGSMITRPETVVRRTLNATVLAFGNGTAAQEAVRAADVNITGTLTLAAWISSTFATGGGHFAIANIEVAAADIHTIYIYTASGYSATSFTGTLVAAQTDTTANDFFFALGNLWYENGYFYWSGPHKTVLPLKTHSILTLSV